MIFDMNHRSLARKAHVCGVGLLLMAVIGCGPVPDMAPFVSATVDLRASVVSAGQVVSYELGSTDQTRQEQFNDGWKGREDTLHAMVLYAESLQAVVAAGNKGAKSAEKVIDSVSELAKAVGHPIPLGESAVEIASDAIKLIAKNMALARAAKSLEESLFRIQPAIEELAELMIQDLTDLDAIIQLANKKAETEFRRRDEFSWLKPYRHKLRTQLMAVDVNTADPATLQRAEHVAKLFETTEFIVAQRDAGLAQIERRLKLSRHLVVKTRLALKEWAIAHHTIAVAIKNRKPVDAHSVLVISTDIRDLMERIQTL